MKFTIMQRWFRHASGTKVYQCYSIVQFNADGRTVRQAVINQWGKAASVPVFGTLSHGQTQLKRGINVGDVTNERLEKGYVIGEPDGRGSEDKISGELDESQFEAWMKFAVPHKHRADLAAHFGIKGFDESVAVDTDDTPPVAAEPAPKTETKTIENPEGWGSW